MALAKEMKIAFLSFYSGIVNRGVETVVHELASRLNASNQVTVFQQGQVRDSSLYSIQRIELRLNQDKKDMTGTWARRFFLDYWSRQIGLFTIKCLKPIIQGNFDIVMTYNGGWSAIIMRLVTWLFGIRMPRVGNPAVKMSGTIFFFSKIIVSGPGKKYS